MLAFAAGRVRRRVVPAILLLTLVCAGNAAAQSFLGTVRGTVVDPQGAAVAGAAVLIVDEATGAPRTLETDAQGRYEATNLKPGTYRVEVVTTNFKKFERPGVLVRAAATALVDVTLEVGSVNETVTVSAERSTTSRSTARRSLAASTSSSCAICRATAATSSRSCSSTRTSSAAARTTSSSSAARPMASRTSRTARRRRTPSSAPIGNSAPGLDAVSEMQVLSNSYSAEYGGLAGVIVTTKRGSSSYHGTGFYDFNSDSLNALTYNQTLTGVERGDPLSDTHEHRWGASLGGPLVRQEAVLLRQLRGVERQGHLRRRPGDRADRGDAQRRLPRHRDHAAGSATRACRSRTR